MGREEEKRDDGDVVEPDDALPGVGLGELTEMMQQAAARAGWTELMPVQAMAMPYLLAGRDLMCQSRTGSGKTGAFVLPMIERIDAAKAACQVLVLVPTRELCVQVSKEVALLCGEAGVRSVAVYGGVAHGPQIDAFRKGAHIVMGTPGRVLDHLMQRSLTLKDLSMLVFDEADRMLSMGFYPDMVQVKGYLPDRPINGYMFSATFPPRVLSLAHQFLKRPEVLSLSSGQVHVTDVQHVVYRLEDPMGKDRCLVRIIELENPDSALIFCNTKVRVRYVTTVLQRFGYDADGLTSDLAQNVREKVLGRVRAGTLRFLVATDVAARGIDLPELSHVFIYETPDEVEAYIHRAGRTGRAGGSGVAISLVAGFERFQMDQITKAYEIDMEERAEPTDADVQSFVAQRVTALLEARLRERDKLQVERMQRFVPLARALGESDDELTVIAMLLDDYYHQTLNKAPQREPGPPAQPPPSGGGSRSGQRRKSQGGRRPRR